MQILTRLPTMKGHTLEFRPAALNNPPPLRATSFTVTVCESDLFFHDVGGNFQTIIHVCANSWLRDAHFSCSEGLRKKNKTCTVPNFGFVGKKKNCSSSALTWEVLLKSHFFWLDLDFFFPPPGCLYSRTLTGKLSRLYRALILVWWLLRNKH